MKSYCLKCRKNVQHAPEKNQDLFKIKKQKGLLSNLGIRIPLSKLPILGNILFSMCI